MRKQILVGFLSLLCGWVSTAQPGWCGELKVMSFNIRFGTANDGPNHWDRRKEFLLETIKTFGPDLLGTQETLGFQMEFLAQGLPDHEAWGVGRDDGKTSGEYSALFYRKSRFAKVDGGHFWLSETPQTAGSRSWDAALPRMVSWVRLQEKSPGPKPPKPILFLNTHFDHRGTRARLESALLIVKKIKEMTKDEDIVLTGDFNADEGSEPYKALFEASENQSPLLIDPFRKVYPEKGSAEGTFSNFRASATRGARIDWIGVSSNWKVVGASIDRTSRSGKTPSDHFPVTATLAR